MDRVKKLKKHGMDMAKSSQKDQRIEVKKDEKYHGIGQGANGKQEKEQEKQNLKIRDKENKKQIKNGKKHIENDFFTDTLRIPADVSKGDFRITITGDSRIWIENYRSILEYSDQKILLQGNKNRLGIEGERLCIDYYTREDMMVRGTIRIVKLT